MTTEPITPQVMTKRPVGRPAKVTTLVPERAPADRARVANNYHALSRTAAQDAVSYAVMAGLELAAAKGEMEHGSFQPWIERNCEFTYRTAARYMQLAEKMVASGAFRSVMPSLPNGQVQTAGDRKALMAAIRETADGETLRQLYFDYDILKPRGETGPGGAREGAGRPTREVYQQKIAANIDAEWDGICKPLGRFITEQRYLYMDPQRQQTILDVLRGCVDMMEKVLQRK